MSEGTPPKSNDGSGEMLWGFWYPALRSDQVRGRKLERAMLLEVPLVIGRDTAGKAFALRDICPHRGVPLSAGRVMAEDTVECPYHGSLFEVKTGRVLSMPAVRPVKTYPVKVVDDEVFVEIA